MFRCLRHRLHWRLWKVCSVTSNFTPEQYEVEIRSARFICFEISSLCSHYESHHEASGIFSKDDNEDVKYHQGSTEDYDASGILLPYEPNSRLRAQSRSLLDHILIFQDTARLVRLETGPLSL